MNEDGEQVDYWKRGIEKIDFWKGNIKGKGKEELNAMVGNERWVWKWR